MKKSTRVTLTVVAAIGSAYSQPANPCAPAGFNEKACRTALKRHGYCDGASWVSQDYQGYPYYYDIYRAYSSAGGVVTPVQAGSCSAIRHGGFGSIGAAHGNAHS